LPHPITHAQPPLEFIPPALNLPVVGLAQLMLPTWLRSRTNITRIQADNVETLVDLYSQFQSGKIRFLMAFRHPSANDPLSMLYLLSRLVPRVARQQGISLKSPIHSHFIYDRGIPLWAGSIVSWLYPRLGGTPIHRGKLDRAGLRSARDLFANGSLPIAAAPEGATNGHNEIVSPLEPGIAQMGFWCVEDLLKAGRSEQVFIVPVGIQYRYVNPPWKSLEKLLSALEVDCGLPVRAVHPPSVYKSEETHKSLYRRLYRLGEHLLTLMEEFYTKFYHQKFPAASKKEVSAILETEKTSGFTEVQPSNYNVEFTARLQALLDVALQVGEEYFNLQPKGSLIDRCRRLEQAGWDYIYREDIKNPEALSPLERGLADRIAAEANLRMWHMRLVESFVAVTGAYVLEKNTADRFADTTLLMWDMITRIKGGNPFPRPRLGKQWVQMTVGQPISVSERWDTYQVSRRSAKQAVADLTQDLQTALESMIS
jgi:1-acyl-sn-glycerol-3-phosphate acyltransferase